jgi:hypothetical protein
LGRLLGFVTLATGRTTEQEARYRATLDEISLAQYEAALREAGYASK